jgi:hypothetical protein
MEEIKYDERLLTHIPTSELKTKTEIEKTTLTEQKKANDLCEITDLRPSI